MGKYTQTLYEYMTDYELDPMSTQDRLTAARQLIDYKYDVPTPIMDNLLDRFILKYMMHEVAFGDLNVFRLYLLNYVREKQSWYERMFVAFQDLLPYEMLEQVTSREGKQKTLNERILKGDTTNERSRNNEGIEVVNRNESVDRDRNLQNTTNNVVDREGSNQTIVEGTDKNTSSGSDVTTGSGTSKSNSMGKNGKTIDGNDSGTSHTLSTDTKEGVSKNTRTDDTSSKTDNTGTTSVVSTDSVTGAGKDTTVSDTTSSDHKTGDNGQNETKLGADKHIKSDRTANGYGSITDIVESGAMIDGTQFVNGDTTVNYDNTVTRENTVDETTTGSSDTNNTTNSENHQLTEGTNTTTDNTSSVTANTGTQVDEATSTDTTNVDSNTETENIVHRTESDTSTSDTESNTTNNSETRSSRLDNGSRNETNSGTSEDSEVSNGQSNQVESGVETKNGLEDRNRKDTEVESLAGTQSQNESGSNDVDSNEVTRVTGVNAWKPELARKFYDNYVGVDNEWLDGARDLFVLIY